MSAARVLLQKLGLRPSYPSRGLSLTRDIGLFLPNEQVRTIFDIGANVGQSLEGFGVFHGARILAFEPDPQTFAQLQDTAAGAPGVRAFQLAFGSSVGTCPFDNRNPDTTLRRVSRASGDNLPQVAMETLDHFCEAHDICEIDLLKIDTEGHDLEVLRGAHRMLSGSAIGIVVVECSANTDNRYHVQFCEMHQFMENHGYRLFGIYEQVAEWPTKRPNLRRINPAYISSKVIARNVGRPKRPR